MDRYARLLASRPDEARKWINNFNRDWRALCERAKVTADEFHSLRKSRITLWLEDGVKPHVVRELAGHKDIETTMRYYTKVRDSARDAARQSSNSFKPSDSLTNHCRIASGSAG
ncbi:MAG: tyrosine-type recombinase/integrase, partial [Phycisphaerales bacterium]|nr:tyrosine-type recombinase/integrase [Phycisphaerales bacterium]